MNSSVFIFILILTSILISNRLSPRVYIQPYQRLLLIILVFTGSLTALFPHQVAGPMTRLLQINRTSDIIVYFIIIFILAVLNALYRETRDINAKLTRLMQINAIDTLYRTKNEK